MSDAPALLDLSTPRTIVLTDRNQTFTLKCRRLTDADWIAYFAGIVVTSENDGKSRINVSDVDSPRLALAEAVLVDAEGYKVAGDVALTSIEGWRKKIPLAHRARLGQTLADASISESEDEFVIYPESEVVSIDATWTDTTGRNTTMDRYLGLRHFLQTPSEEQHRRYTRESSRSRIVGGSRNGKTIYQGSQLLLAKLYDELIVSVEGYAANGRALSTDRPVIIREMDMFHKVIVALQLFSPSSTVTLATDEATD